MIIVLKINILLQHKSKYLVFEIVIASLKETNPTHLEKKKKKTSNTAALRILFNDDEIV